MKQLCRAFMIAAMLIGVVGPPALADWAEADGHKMHFPQLPDELGWDVRATNPIILADDWECSETGWVKDIHFWGSWMHGTVGQIISFNLSIHADIPADQSPTEYSMPGETLWEREIPIDQVIVREITGGLEGWYDPETGQWFTDDHDTYYQYNVFLPEADWFPQDSGTIYWLNISATVNDPAATQWGWKSTLDHWNDDAVWAYWGDLSWIDLWEPPEFTQSLDLAFVITGGPDAVGACCYPDPTGAGYPSLCIETTQDSCLNHYIGLYEGDGTTCGGMQACCLTDGTCVDADSLCCVNELGGTPLGTGTACGGIQACCLPSGECRDMDSACCAWGGATPQGAGTSCAAATIACCLPDGSCVNVDQLCCDDLGGVPSPIGASACLGDGDGNGIDDACEEEPIGACCYAGGTAQPTLCVETTQDSCINHYGGIYEGDGTTCGGIQACCLTGGACVDADSICCVNELGGTPLGPGTACGGIQACCLQTGECRDMDSACCAWGGGTPQGVGTVCSPTTIACCLPDGSCIDVDSLCCDDLGGAPSPTGAAACLGDGNGNGIDDACEEELDTCTYYKPPYNDYAPAGMPDFDQKQDNWIYAASGTWSHCGPVALANCLWWFDSKYEANTSPPPPTVSDSYNLLWALGAWDDHDAQNVMPFVDSLALYCKTNVPGSGTLVWDLEQGAKDWVTNAGLAGDYIIRTFPVESGAFGFEDIRYEVLASQDVILLLGFYQDPGGGYCERVGGHYVTIAGICEDPADSTICISDPFFDKNGGGPPPPHGSSVHNDAQYVSGPHGTMHHDAYDVIPTTCQWFQPPAFQVELANYPITVTTAGNFQGQNTYDPDVAHIDPEPGLAIHTVIEFALIICPDTTPEPTGACCYENTAGELALCTETTQDSCVNVLGGVYEGDGTTCAGQQACCLPGGICIDADSICCVNELGGTPQGPGTVCGNIQACCLPDNSCADLDSLCCVEIGGEPLGPGTQCTAPEACCLPDGSCQMLDPLCCQDVGGTPQGTGTICSPNTAACCLPNGGCIDVDPLCCDDMGGVPSPISAPACLGDGNGNGIDDACEQAQGACCWTDGSCTLTGSATCVDNGGDYKGDGTVCLGDINGNGIDDICENLWWGHKMHFPQLPDENGWDVYATNDENDPARSISVADDWMCTETGWVKDIHFWGSWKGGQMAPILGFYLRIWSNIPADQSPTGYSMPGDTLWEKMVIPQETYLDSPLQGWYDPQTGEVIPDDHQQYIRYDVYLDSLDWFWQEEGNVYWLSIICVALDTENFSWGWKSSNYHFMDDAVWAQEEVFNWFEIYEPPDFETSLDLAFVITGQPCDCVPGDANNDGPWNVADATYLINYVFKGGPAPVPYAICSGDPNCDCAVNIADAVYMINYVFKGGPPPCTCQDWATMCGWPLYK